MRQPTACIHNSRLETAEKQSAPFTPNSLLPKVVRLPPTALDTSYAQVLSDRQKTICHVPLRQVLYVLGTLTIDKRSPQIASLGSEGRKQTHFVCE